jgi:hypothetical protein
MHFAKPMLQSLPLFTVGWHVGQSLANVVFPVPEPLAVLPSLPIVARLLPGLGAKSGYHGDRDLNVGLRERRTLSKDWSLRNALASATVRSETKRVFIMAPRIVDQR